MFWLLFGKKEVEKVREDTKKSFEDVKKDVQTVNGWIKHLDSEKNIQKMEIEGLKEALSTIKEEIEGIKNIVSMMSEIKRPRVFKTPTAVLDKQTAVYAVQTGVQTAVQTPEISDFSITERAIIWVLLNTDMGLSYEDIASVLGKERSTIRGQINAIKRKSEGLIIEKIEKNGKKRLYITEDTKNLLLKKSKVRALKSKKQKN